MLTGIEGLHCRVLLHGMDMYLEAKDDPFSSGITILELVIAGKVVTTERVPDNLAPAYILASIQGLAPI